MRSLCVPLCATTVQSNARQFQIVAAQSIRFHPPCASRNNGETNKTSGAETMHPTPEYSPAARRILRGRSILRPTEQRPSGVRTCSPAMAALPSRTFVSEKVGCRCNSAIRRSVGAGETQSHLYYQAATGPSLLDTELNDTAATARGCAVTPRQQHAGPEGRSPGWRVLFYPPRAASGDWSGWSAGKTTSSRLTVTPDYDARTATVKAHTSMPGGAGTLWAVVRAGRPLPRTGVQRRSVDQTMRCDAGTSRRNISFRGDDTPVLCLT